MKKWAWIVAGLYGLILMALTLPVTTAAFFSTTPESMKLRDFLQLYQSWQYWVWIAVMFLAQAALLRVPVDAANRRPMARRSLWLTVGAAGFMMAGLFLGAAYSIFEFVFGEKGPPEALGWTAVGSGLVVWIAWAVLFYRVGKRREAGGLISQQCRLMVKGSVLELLIAVPTHIVARSRDYCCAGFMTFFGLTMGISVMLFAFGPAVFFLYADRWRKLHPGRMAAREAMEAQ
jgi:hypothetical protein